jgi:hypothetical protein
VWGILVDGNIAEAATAAKIAREAGPKDPPTLLDL